MSATGCSTAENQKTYPVADLQVPVCVPATPTTTSTPPVTPSVTPSFTPSAAVCECNVVAPEEQVVVAYKYLPVVTSTPTPSIIYDEQASVSTISYNEGLISVEYINKLTPSCTSMPTPTPISNDYNRYFEIDISVPVFGELDIILNLRKKTISVNHAEDGPLPLSPIKFAWRSSINGVVYQSSADQYDPLWDLVPENKKEFINSYYFNNIKKTAPFVVGHKQWSSSFFINAYIPITSNINIANAVIPPNVQTGQVFVETLPTTNNDYTAVIKLINNEPSSKLISDDWFITIAARIIP